MCLCHRCNPTADFWPVPPCPIFTIGHCDHCGSGIGVYDEIPETCTSRFCRPYPKAQQAKKQTKPKKKAHKKPTRQTNQNILDIKYIRDDDGAWESYL